LKEHPGEFKSTAESREELQEHWLTTSQLLSVSKNKQRSSAMLGMTPWIQRKI